MKMEIDSSKVTTGGSVGETTDFKIAETAEMFMILSSSIYTDKIKAVIRELSTNAFDAHKMADTLDIPFKVHLPTQLEPTFSVRDYGVGLSHEDVVNLYSAYGVSTKNDSNDYVGAMGLGSKSPFAYTSSFVVTSYFNGFVNVYSCYIEGGIPRVTLMESSSTTEANGLDVTINVLMNDIREFEVKAKEVYQWFDFKPTVNIPLSYMEHTSLLSGEGWELYNNNVTPNNSGACVKMGGIVYPIPSNTWEYGNTYNTLASQDILIDVELGDVSMAADRESLSMTKDTTKFIEGKFDEITEKASKGISDEIDKLSSIWEKRVKFNELYNNLPHALRKSMSVVIDGVTVSNTINIEMSTFYFDDAEFTISRFGGWRKSAVTVAKYNNDRLHPKSNTKFIVADKKVGSIQVAREATSNLGGHGSSMTYLLKPKSYPISVTCQAEMDAFIIKLGSPKVEKVSDLYVAPERKKVVKGNKVVITKTELSVKKFYGDSWYSAHSHVVKHTDTFFYVPMYSRTCSYDWAEGTGISHTLLIKTVNKILIKQGKNAITGVFGVNKKDKQEVAKFTDATSIIDYIKDNIDVLSFSTDHKYSNFCSQINDISDLKLLLNHELINHNTLAYKIAKFIDVNGNIDTACVNYNQLSDIEEIGVKLKLTQVKLPTWYVEGEFNRKYPLLAHIRYNSDSVAIPYIIMQDMYDKKIATLKNKETPSATTP